MTFAEAFTSLKSLYKNLMFPKNPQAPKWTMAEIDQLDVHFFHELLDMDEKEPEEQEEDVYLSDIW